MAVVVDVRHLIVVDLFKLISNEYVMAALSTDRPIQQQQQQHIFAVIVCLKMSNKAQITNRTQPERKQT